VQWSTHSRALYTLKDKAAPETLIDSAVSAGFTTRHKPYTMKWGAAFCKFTLGTDDGPAVSVEATALGPPTVSTDGDANQSTSALDSITVPVQNTNQPTFAPTPPSPTVTRPNKRDLSPASSASSDAPPHHSPSKTHPTKRTAADTSWAAYLMKTTTGGDKILLGWHIMDCLSRLMDCMSR
jgi:hypothetical protein